MKALTIVQARVESKRLPGKILFPLAGKNVLWHVLSRTRRIGFPVALAFGGQHHSLVKNVADDLGVYYRCFPDDQADVLGRMWQVSQALRPVHQHTAIVRITADCPFICPSVCKAAVRMFDETHPDICGVWTGEYARSDRWPEGLDCEVIRLETFRRLYANVGGSDREHVTTALWEHRLVGPVVTSRYRCQRDYSDKLSIDTQEDYDRLRPLFEGLYELNPEFDWPELEKYLT